MSVNSRQTKWLGLAVGFLTLITTDFCSGVEVGSSPDQSNSTVSQVMNEARQLVERGQSLFELKQYDDARVQFDRVIDMAPGSGEAYLWRAKVNCATKQNDAEIADLAKAVLLLPTELKWRTHLAQLYLWKKQYDQASTEARAVSSADPSIVTAVAVDMHAQFHQMALARNRTLKWHYIPYKETIRDCRAQGEKYLQDGQLSKAMLSFTTALAMQDLMAEYGQTLSPAPDLHLKRAEIFLAQGEFDRAFVEHQLIVGTWSCFQFKYYAHVPAERLIAIWRERKDDERVIKLERFICDTHQTNWLGKESLIRQAQYLDQTNRPLEAKAALLTCIDGWAKDPHVRLVLADWYGRHSEPSCAIEEYGIVISLSKQDQRHANDRAAAFVGRAKIREAQGELHRALADYEGALDADDSFVEAIRGQQRLSDKIKASGTDESLEGFKEVLGDLENLISKE